MSHPETPITILCVDDHPLIREGIAALIANATDMQLVAEAANGVEAIEQFRRHRPDVTLLDLKMPRMGGLEALKAIRHEASDAKVVVLTTYPGDIAAQRALANGARAYLLKTDVRNDLLTTIRDVHAGQMRINADVARSVASQIPDSALSAKELRVLELIATGRTNRDIGEVLFLAEGTVKNHVKSILAKLGAHDRTHAVMIGLERGMIGV